MASSKYMRQNTPSDNPNMALSKYAEINFKSSTGLNEVILEDESQGDDSNLLSPNNKNSIKTPFSVKTQVRMMSPCPSTPSHLRTTNLCTATRRCSTFRGKARAGICMKVSF